MCSLAKERSEICEALFGTQAYLGLHCNSHEKKMDLARPNVVITACFRISLIDEA